MKIERLLPAVFLGLSLLRLPASGQDAATNAAAVAEKQGVDEKFKQLAADIQSLRDANQLLLDKVSALKEDLQQIRAEQSRLAAAAVGRDDLKPLAQRIEEVDKRRQDDKDAISEQIKTSEARLQKLLTSSAADTSAKSPGPGATPAAPGTPDGFIYTIKEHDYFMDILKAYNETFKSKGMKTISLKQLEQANPDVDPNRLKVGQKIVIPHPAE
ncbi:MAG: LysM peptidoglycan-binding domain-containing protein [Verrucomicrobiota bacterium]|jgi:DNA repair exonuclease SbcCD ATPase subunit